MNLREFLDHRTHCPFCEFQLVTTFHSQKWQSVKDEDGRCVIQFRLNAIKKHQMDYKVGYSFSYTDNSWYVEFYNKDDKRFESDSPNFLIKRFKELDSNLKQYRFYRHCKNCYRYTYQSKYFTLDFKTGKINDYSLSSEYFGLCLPFNDKFKICRLNINYKLEQSYIFLSEDTNPNNARFDNDYSHIPSSVEMSTILKFSSEEETMDRINKLMVFS